MGLLNMNPNEYEYYTKNISEAMKLIGHDAVYYPIRSSEDLYQDYDIELSEHYEIGVIFDDDPRPVLKKNGWLTEDEELPFTATIVAKDINQKNFELKERALIILKSTYGITQERKFLIGGVRGNSISPLVFACKLVPYREKIEVKTEVKTIESKKNDIEETTPTDDYEKTIPDEETLVVSRDYPESDSATTNDSGYSFLKR